jgi:hypothetical protein
MYAPAQGYAYGPPMDVTPKERRSVGMMVGGSVLIGVGGLVSIIGSFVALGNTSTSFTCSGDFCSSDSGSGGGAGVAMIVGGLVGVAVGIPLLVYGAKKVPVKAEGAPAAAKWIGAPGARGWQWQF